MATEAAGLQLRVVHEHREAELIWSRIEAELGEESLASGWDWTDVWLRQYGDLVPHHFVVASNARGPVGIALITNGVRQRRGPLPVRTRHLGTAGEPQPDSACVEYNRLMVLAEHRVPFLALVLDHLRRRRWGWDIVELNGFDPNEIEELRSLEPGFELEHRVCHVADLAAAREIGKDPVDLLRKSVAAKVRKNLHWCEERFGPIRTEWIDDIDIALAALDELAELHQARWVAAGYPGSFSSARFREFHRALVRRMLPSGRVVLFRVTAGDQTIGTFYGFVERGRVNHYQWGLSRFDDNALSPGFVVGALFMRAASKRGYDELNWLAGDVRYKRDLSTNSRELVWAQWHRGPWAWFIDSLVKLRGSFRARRNQVAVSEVTTS